MRSMLRSLAAGALAGGAATLAMSPIMAPRLTRTAAGALPPAEPLDEFPPRRIVQVAEERATGRRPLPDAAEAAITWAAHIGYGTAMGALYGATAGATAEPEPRTSPAAAGALFGLGVWAAGYLGWLPVFGVREGTIRGRPADIPFPLAAHVVYGITLGIVHDRLR